MATLLLVDGHAYAYRAFHAIRRLQAPDGKPTNAIFGFIKMLGRMRGVVSATHLAVVWDGGLSPERVKLLPAYKAQRPAMPDDLSGQIDEVATYLNAAGVVSVQQSDVEADDLIASLARVAVADGVRVVIASSDKDFFQLVGSAVGLLNPGDKSETVWTAAEVVGKTGVEPTQVVDWLSLIGDTVDNIEGVAGVGPKTAAELLKKFGSVEAIYAGLASVGSERLRGALSAAADAVRRNQQMIRLKDDLPVPAVKDLVALTPDPARLLELFRRWGFRTMAAELEQFRPRQEDLFASGA
jgi:DNA polymerase-1